MTPRARRHSAIRARDVLSAAAYAGRRQWQRVLGVALVVFGLTTLLETLADNFGHEWSVGWVVAIDVLAFGADLFGEVFYVGLLDRLVGTAVHGHAPQSVPTVLRTLRYGPLILAAVLAAALAILGLFVLIVPGVVLFTLLCLSGPILNIEGLSAVRALRRSAQLVRRRFWLTFVMVTVPFFVADWVTTSVQDAAHGLPLAADFVIHAVVATAIAIVTGLVQVELAHSFIEADHERRAGS
ncbi:MAG TPA: hypothetical protein VG476_03980 [Acidimicrobiales bacterium]|nr:hypothetical protein [Acidimicrobiales bacterium]